MIDFPAPETPFNFVTARAPFTPLQALATPLGLIALLPLIPLLRWTARRSRAAAMVATGVVWMALTLGPRGTATLLALIAVGTAYVYFVWALRRSSSISARSAIAAVWIGLHALILPFWWFPSKFVYGWEPTPLAMLHAAGVAYFLLRLVDWGVAVARRPESPYRLADTLAWLFYPVCMRLGPVLRREEFLERFDAWNPQARPPWRTVALHLACWAVGVVLLAVVTRNLPYIYGNRADDYFAAPELYKTSQIVRAIYLIPVQIYLLMWSYNELAYALGAWVGVRVDQNFNWLPAATSVRDFWRRWHVTVGAWLRDHIYVPVGGKARPVLGYFAVFGYCSVWHGAAWPYLVWGGAQAAALAAEHWLRPRAAAEPAPLLRRAVGWLFTMHFAVVTIFIFSDYHHGGARVAAELWRRWTQG